jgi:hypothetical protein
VYFDAANTAIVPTWLDLKHNAQPVSRVAPWVGWDMGGYVTEAQSVDDLDIIGDVGAPFDFNLRPAP